MVGLFKRLFKVGSAEAHALVDKMEDPVKMSEQAIRDLRNDLKTSMEGLAEVKAITIRTKRELQQHAENATDYEKKAMALLQKAQVGDIEASEAERLATQALEMKQQHTDNADRLRKEVDKYESMTANLEHKVQDLRGQITKWENELRTLKARSRISSATKKINMQMANVDSSGTISTLEKMKQKVDEEEALAESYGEMAASYSGSVDDEIDKVLSSKSGSSSDALADLKAKMGMK